MIEKVESDILQLEQFFFAVRDYLVQQNSWSCYIEGGLEPATLNPKTSIFLYGENGTDNKESSGERDLKKCINIGLKSYDNSIQMLGLKIILSMSGPKTISITKNQVFNSFLNQYKPSFLASYEAISRRRILEKLIPAKFGETKQTKI